MLHLDHMNRESYGQLQNLTVHHATAGIKLLVQHRNSYSNAYLSPLLLVCLVQLCDSLVRYDGIGDTTPNTIEFCLTSLEDARAGYPVAGPLQKMFCNSLAEYKLAIPDGVKKVTEESMRLELEELLDSCTRATYRQPISQFLPNVHETAAQEFITRWRHLFSHENLSEERSRANSVMSGSGRRVEIGSLLNP